MYKLKLIILTLFQIICTPVICDAANMFTLEHTFDGYYNPYNFPMEIPSDNDRYFYDVQPKYNADTHVFSTTTYNEDYSLRRSISLTIKDIPTKYYVNNVVCSPYFTLQDGTPLVAVVLCNTDYQELGMRGYAKCRFYNVNNGTIIYEMESSHNIIPNNIMYSINGKRSFVVFRTEYDKAAPYDQILYKTDIYSVGDTVGKVIEQTPENTPYVMEIYDLSGRSIGKMRQQFPSVKIIRMSDGSSKKVLE